MKTRRKRRSYRRNPTRARRRTSRRRPSARRTSRRRRSGRRMAVARRSYRRNPIALRRRRRSRGGGGRAISLKSLLDRDTLTIAGGAVASGFVTTFVLNRFGGAGSGFRLPMSDTVYGQIGYQLLIPFAGAYAVRNVNRNFARGLMLGGVIAALQSVLAVAIPKVQAATNGTGRYPRTRGVGAYLSAPPVTPMRRRVNGAGAMPPGYMAVDAYGASPYESENAFGGDAW